MEAEVTATVGAKHAKIPDRAATRHASVPGSVVLGGRRVRVSRPRVRTVDTKEEVRLEKNATAGRPTSMRTNMTNESVAWTQDALALGTAEIGDLEEETSALAWQLFVEFSERGEEATMQLAIGLMNLAAILTGRLARATGRTPGEELQRSEDSSQARRAPDGAPPLVPGRPSTDLSCSQGSIWLGPGTSRAVIARTGHPESRENSRLSEHTRGRRRRGAECLLRGCSSSRYTRPGLGRAR